MRAILFPIAGLMVLANGAADAGVDITVDKNEQRMTVSVDGVTKYNWPVSSGNPSHETPNGNFRTFRMEEDHYSKEFDDAPMPHAIFFTKQGHAIHGTDSVNRLGTPASHGCVRLSRANAQTLWDIVKAEGVLNTTVTLTGSSQVALARNPRSNAVAAARQPAPRYDAYGQPLQIAPSPQTAQQYVPSDQYGEDIYANSRARMPSSDRDYANQTYQGQTYQVEVHPRSYYYGSNDARWPQQQQRRIYVDTQTGQQYYAQDDYGDDARYGRPQYYYRQRGY
ncbi:MAG: L,D-transpeptidase [Afipia sp.]|nr:L,D-transpeptidase [Afipia sp.]